MFFVDTNVLARYFTGPNDPLPANQAKGRAAKALFDRVDNREERVVTNLATILETVYLLERSYKLPKRIVADVLNDFVAMPGLVLDSKSLVLDALELHAQYNFFLH